MDDIQFWIYILFGLIYVITRALRKKQPEEPTSPTEESGEGRPQRRQPKSFEELLREFTEAGTVEEESVEEVRETRPVRAESPAYEARSRKASSGSDLAGEGETRHFADDESRKIYEDSIRQAEASPISYERDEHFKISRGNLRSPRTGVSTSPVAKEVREILSSPTSARKAIILAEILNRKY